MCFIVCGVPAGDQSIDLGVEGKRRLCVMTHLALFLFISLCVQVDLRAASCNTHIFSSSSVQFGQYLGFNDFSQFSFILCCNNKNKDTSLILISNAGSQWDAFICRVKLQLNTIL